MSKIVELYVKELTREGSTMTINDVAVDHVGQLHDAALQQLDGVSLLGDGFVLLGLCGLFIVQLLDAVGSVFNHAKLPPIDWM